MRKYAILVVLMAFIVSVTAGCGLIVKDEAVDAQTVIIEVAGETFVKSVVKQTTENILDYQEYMYSLYGYPYDRTDADAIASAQESAINSLIQEAVTDQKIAEYGLDQFTDEELAALTQKTEDTYTGYLETVKSQYFDGTDLTGEALDAAVEEQLVTLGYSTKDELMEQNKKTEELSRLRAKAVEDVSVSEDDITDNYNEGLARQMAAYAEDLTQYAADVNNGEIIYFHPHDYRYVKNLLIKISDEDRTQLSNLTNMLSDDQNSLNSIETALADLPEDTTADTDEEKQSRTELLSQQESLTAEIEDLTAQVEELTVTAYGAIEDKVAEVQAKIDEGKEFDALLEVYGEDTGMMTEPQKSQGYLVCLGLTNYVEEFVTQSMLLQTIGEISPPFRTNYGVHFVQYASDLDDGKVPLSSIHDEIAEKMLTDKQTTVYNETVSQWVTDADATIYLDKLND